MPDIGAYDYDPMVERTGTYPPTWRIWVCRCGGDVLWRERPRHMTCAQCGALIREIEVGQVHV